MLLESEVIMVMICKHVVAACDKTNCRHRIPHERGINCTGLNCYLADGRDCQCEEEEEVKHESSK